MVEELENEVSDLLTKVTPVAVPPNKNVAEIEKKLKEEQELREKMETQKKKLEEELAELNKKMTSNDSGEQFYNFFLHKLLNFNFWNWIFAVKTWKEKCEKLEKEKSDLVAKMGSSDLVDLETLHQARQEKHKLQKEVCTHQQLHL